MESISEFYGRGIEIIDSKNNDYARESDPFKNFRSAEVAGVNVGRAILVRILDKMSRVSNLLDREASVKDETINDTLLDMANYIAILNAYLENGD